MRGTGGTGGPGGATHHTGSLQSLAEPRSIGLTPHHVAAEGAGSTGHDEGEGADVASHPHEGQEPHTALAQHRLCLGGTGGHWGTQASEGPGHPWHGEGLKQRTGEGSLGHHRRRNSGHWAPTARERGRQGTHMTGRVAPPGWGQGQQSTWDVTKTPTRKGGRVTHILGLGQHSTPGWEGIPRGPTGWGHNGRSYCGSMVQGCVCLCSPSGM